MLKADYDSVVNHGRLENGLAWAIPITLPVAKEEAEKIKEGEKVILTDDYGVPLAVLEVQEKFSYDKKKEALSVFKTEDSNHPGVANLFSTGGFSLGGSIIMINRPGHAEFLDYRLDPQTTRSVFKEKSWKRVAGFQTRNPIHRAHEYIQKCALEVVDGLFLHPLVGETKAGDTPAQLIIRSYEVVIEKYFPKNRVVLGVLDMAMRYAGPKEAIHHAIVRMNYGCTHFIVGRDHAGVGKYYGPFDAHHIFDEYNSEELAITPLFFDATFYCKRCGNMASYKTCPHDAADHLTLSGTKVRGLLEQGEEPEAEVTRPEVARVLIEGMEKRDYQI
jgi:sulfate adenylyltransferase